MNNLKWYKELNLECLHKSSVGTHCDTISSCAPKESQQNQKMRSYSKIMTQKSKLCQNCLRKKEQAWKHGVHTLYINPSELVWDEMDRRVKAKQSTSATHFWAEATLMGQKYKLCLEIDSIIYLFKFTSIVYLVYAFIWFHFIFAMRH